MDFKQQWKADIMKKKREEAEKVKEYFSKGDGKGLISKLQEIKIQNLKDQQDIKLPF